MSTIIFAAAPAMGHLNASLTLAKSLSARGHEIYYLQGLRYQTYIEDQGVRFIPLGESIASGEAQIALLDRLMEFRQHGRPLDDQLLKLIEVFRQQIASLVRTLKPDLFLVDPYIPDIASIAHQLAAPFVFVNPTLVDISQLYDAPEVATVPELVLCPAEFDLPKQAVRGKRKRYFVAAEVNLQRHEELFNWSRINPDKPLIYCALGTHIENYSHVQRFFETIIEAVGNLPQYQLILATVANPGHDSFKNVPANVLLLKHAPQLQILQRTSIFITHGGLNSIKEALYYGVPMVVFPCWVDQPMNASRIAYHRLGLTGDLPTVTVEEVCALIQKVAATNLYRERANHFRDIIKQYEEAQVSVTVVEALLRLVASTPHLAAYARG